MHRIIDGFALRVYEDNLVLGNIGFYLELKTFRLRIDTIALNRQGALDDLHPHCKGRIGYGFFRVEGIAFLIQILNRIGQIVQFPLRIDSNIMLQRPVKVVAICIRLIKIPTFERITITLFRDDLFGFIVDGICDGNRFSIIIFIIKRNLNARQFPACVKRETLRHFIVALVQARKLRQCFRVRRINEGAGICRATRIHKPSQECGTFDRCCRLSQVCGNARIILDIVRGQSFTVVSKQVEFIGICQIVEVNLLSVVG